MNSLINVTSLTKPQYAEHAMFDALLSIVSSRYRQSDADQWLQIVDLLITD